MYACVCANRRPGTAEGEGSGSGNSRVGEKLCSDNRIYRKIRTEPLHWARGGKIKLRLFGACVTVYGYYGLQACYRETPLDTVKWF